MVRIGGILVGLGFVFALFLGIIDTFSNGLTTPKTVEQEFHKHAEAPEGGFTFTGMFGTYDKRQLQRGMQVYKEVCAACHSLRLVSFRDLAALGYSEGQIKTIAKGFQVPSINPETGEPATRDGMPADRFPSPYANDVAARAANNNAIPPDLSLITKARHNGSEYVYSLLTGYRAPPAELAREFPEFEVGPGLHYNPYFKSLALAMAPPITANGQVTYADGAPAPTIQQMSEDVSAFLTWTAEPKMEQRRQTGVAVLIFLLFATVLAYLSKQQIWSAIKPRRAD